MTGTPAPENAGLPDWSAPGREEPPAEAPRRSHGRPYGGSHGAPYEGEPYRGAPWPASGAWPAPPETHPGHPDPAFGHPAPPETHPGHPTAPDPAFGRSAPPETHPGHPDPAFGHPAVQAPPVTPAAPVGPALQSAASEPPPAGLPWMAAPRQVFPDEQVWPPVPRPVRESPGSSTQPFPAVPTPPLPRPASAPARGVPAPVTAASPVAAPNPAPAVPPPASPPDASRTSGETPPTAGAAAPAPRRRTAPRIGGLLVAVALAVGIPTWDGYHYYRTRLYPALHFHSVEPGGSKTLMHVAWRAQVESADSLPGGGKAKPGRKWLKITVFRTSLDTEGVIRRGDPTIKAVHPDGRSWQVLVSDKDLPLEVKEHKIGTAYRYNAVSVVPQEVADEVELHVLPHPARLPLEEQPVEDLFKPDETETEPQDQVLVFRR
ncbi:hypothetical protein Ppa06_13760 [Planomonospora parontospora subsp. parontospora]|uniref:Uncharacterized protein n=2 Tax=Planomonospora parontospora TaxID=58119 RepID=A0AA37BDX4_9ACTN|nr:hypothetical protein [Planomonospora parontospora]GGK53889.1 hypothetical protein GCM10010126_11810 [Planomonospora parontospora]GII07578.1 hypothetical protein Ppa06_13760 [Planomonospora parontospora subsp. parontospora]